MRHLTCDSILDIFPCIVGNRVHLCFHIDREATWLGTGSTSTKFLRWGIVACLTVVIIDLSLDVGNLFDVLLILDQIIILERLELILKSLQLSIKFLLVHCGIVFWR